MPEMTLSEFLGYAFSENSVVLYPLIAGILISLCSALIGTGLVQKRYSMIGDGLSHFGFFTMALALVIGVEAYITVSLPLVMIAAFLLLRIKENSKIKADAVIAIIATSSLAIGTLMMTSLDSVNGVRDVCNYMFGNNTFFGMTDTDFVISVIMSLALIFSFVLLYNRFFAVTFDDSFARASGVKADVYNTLLALMVAIVIVVGMKIMGTMLISSLIIFPSLSAARIFRKYKSVILLSSVISVGCYIFGFVFSCMYGLAPGASVVIVNLAVFCICAAIGKIKNSICKKKVD